MNEGCVCTGTDDITWSVALAIHAEVKQTKTRTREQTQIFRSSTQWYVCLSVQCRVCETMSLSMEVCLSVCRSVRLYLCSTRSVRETMSLSVNKKAIHTGVQGLRVRLRSRLRQIATLCLWDVASDAKNGYWTNSWRFDANCKKKTHSVNGPLSG